MNIGPIRTEDDYAAALARIEALWDAKPGTEAFEELDALATLVDAHERTHHAIEPHVAAEVLESSSPSSER